MSRSAFGPAADRQPAADVRQQIAELMLAASGIRPRIDARDAFGIPVVTTVAWPDPQPAPPMPEPPGPWIDPAWWERAITEGDA
jgi:hypothetical protein